MIIKLEKIINCSSEHPSYPASNLLQYRSNSMWKCAKPGEMLATVIFRLAEPSCIIGVDIGNYQSCVVIITASTDDDPDNWIPIVNHRFMTHDEAANNKFQDQVQLFTKRELDPETIKIKFDRVKITCMQYANLKELFGLSFVVLRTEVVVDLGLDVFGKFKLKKTNAESSKPDVDKFKEQYLKLVNTKKMDYKTDLRQEIKDTAFNNFSKRQTEGREPTKRPLLQKLEEGKADQIFVSHGEASTDGSNVDDLKTKINVLHPTISNNIETLAKQTAVERTPFGDVGPSSKVAKENTKLQKQGTAETVSRKRSSCLEGNLAEKRIKKNQECTECNNESEDTICKTCNRLPKPKETAVQPIKVQSIKALNRQKLFQQLMEDVRFSLSGYVNPQRDNIRRKALRMGAKYIADPDTTNNKCTHLVCAFKKTPKYQRLKGHCKIVSHTYIEDCFEERTRFPWRRYALNSQDKNAPESEEEIKEIIMSSPRPTDPFEEDTDSESNY